MPNPYPSYYTSGTTWQQWNVNYVTITSSNATTLLDPWPAWNTTAATTTIHFTWDQWNIAYTPTAAERRRMRERAEEAHRRTERIVQERADAIVRAEALLLDHLDADQAAEYREHRHFHVVTRRGRRYRITCGRQHNVHQVDDTGRPMIEFCAHVRDAIPDHDNVLAQKLMLEHDEDAFLAVANSRALVTR